MSKTDPRVDDYIAAAAGFAQPILKHLRALVHQACPEVEETIKWGFPHFTYRGILCSMAAFKAHCVFGFWKGDLLFRDDPAAKQKASMAMGHFGRIATLADLPPDRALLIFIRKAACLNETGLKPPARSKHKRPSTTLNIPAYVVTALKSNPRAQAAFDQLSYSHKKEYVEWITEAKREDTRARRLQTALQWMAQGKSRNWKYARC
jgi:hypothetical protein